MPVVVRVGDINSAGGAVIKGVDTVVVGGQPAAYLGSPVTPHDCCGSDGCASHCGAIVAEGSATVFVGNKPAVYVGAGDSCGHTRAAGDVTVIIGR
jgi:uncharacterized Zn-binding protein involved in type VI secretion